MNNAITRFSIAEEVSLNLTSLKTQTVTLCNTLFNKQRPFLIYCFNLTINFQLLQIYLTNQYPNDIIVSKNLGFNILLVQKLAIQIALSWLLQLIYLFKFDYV